MLTRLLKLWGELFFLYSFLFIFPAGSIRFIVDSIDTVSVCVGLKGHGETCYWTEIVRRMST